MQENLRLNHLTIITFQLELLLSTHTQNGLAESLIKCLQLIARPILMRTKFPSSCLAYAILHVVVIIRTRPTAYHKYSLLQLIFGRELDISHLKIFSFVLYVPIVPPQRTKMDPQRKLKIYV